MPIPDKIINEAVEWWVNVIQSPRFDNGDFSGASFFAFTLASIASDKIRISDEQINIFKEVLKDRIKKESQSYPELVILHADYGPGGILREAFDKAKISHLKCPWKTVMWIEPNKIRVCYGYQAPIKTIYSEE